MSIREGAEAPEAGAVSPASAMRQDVTPRPPAPGEPVAVLDGPLPTATLFTLRYGDEIYAFVEGSWGRFGRDDDTCEIPVWEEINHNRLSRVAGEVWCADGEMWLRNLSTTHEMAVAGGAGQPQWLPRRDVGERGPACSFIGASSRVLSPSTGSWELLVEKVRTRPDPATTPDASATQSLGILPRDLRPTAVALCAPILERDDPPATYDQVAQSLGLSRRQARRHVDRLCAHYAGQYPVDDEAQSAGYAPLARLLVRRGLVTGDDVARLQAEVAGNLPRPGVPDDGADEQA